MLIHTPSIAKGLSETQRFSIRIQREFDKRFPLVAQTVSLRYNLWLRPLKMEPLVT